MRKVLLSVLSLVLTLSLTGCFSKKAKVNESNLEYTNLSNSNIKETIFKENNISMSSFGECKLKNTKFNE